MCNFCALCQRFDRLHLWKQESAWFYHNCDIDNIINMKLILGHHKKITYQFRILFCVGYAHRHDTNDTAKISPSMIFNGRHRWMVVCAICRMCTQLAVIHFSKEKLSLRYKFSQIWRKKTHYKITHKYKDKEVYKCKCWAQS